MTTTTKINAASASTANLDFSSPFPVTADGFVLSIVQTVFIVAATQNVIELHRWALIPPNKISRWWLLIDLETDKQYLVASKVFLKRKNAVNRNYNSLDNKNIKVLRKIHNLRKKLK